MLKGDVFNITVEESYEKSVHSTHEALKDFAIAEVVPLFKGQDTRPGKDEGTRFRFVEWLEKKGYIKRLNDTEHEIHLGAFGEFTPTESER